MEEARRVLERLERIEALDRAGAAPRAVLGELRELLREAEAWSRVEGGEAGSEAVGRLRRALLGERIPNVLPDARSTRDWQPATESSGASVRTSASA